MRLFLSSLGRLLQVFQSSPCPGLDMPVSAHGVIDSSVDATECGEPGDLSVLGLCSEPPPGECRGEMAGFVSRVGGREITSVVDTSRHALL